MFGITDINKGVVRMLSDETAIAEETLRMDCEELRMRRALGLAGPKVYVPPGRDAITTRTVTVETGSRLTTAESSLRIERAARRDLEEQLEKANRRILALETRLGQSESGAKELRERGVAVVRSLQQQRDTALLAMVTVCTNQPKVTTVEAPKVRRIPEEVPVKVEPKLVSEVPRPKKAPSPEKKGQKASDPEPVKWWKD